LIAVFSRGVLEAARDPLGVDVIQKDRFGVRVERVRDRRRTQRTAADADGEQRVGVGDGLDRRSNLVRIGPFGEVQRLVAVFLVCHSALDALVGGRHLLVQALEGLPRDAR